MTRLLFIIFSLLAAIQAQAVLPQEGADSTVTSRPSTRRCLVMDLDNRVPMLRADVAFADGRITHTDNRGYFSMPDTASFVIIAKNGYDRQKVSREEIGDTIFMSMSAHTLPEFTVVAPYKLSEKDFHLDISKVDMQLLSQPTYGPTLDLLGLAVYIYNLLHHSHAKKDKTKMILDNY